MTVVKLVRWTQSSPATFGRLYIGTHSWLTVERSGTGVHPCIPVGTYPLVLDTYHKGGYPAYEVRGVTGRSRILIHAANRASELEGCIAPGNILGLFNGEIGVTASRDALAGFMRAMAGQPDPQLVVTETYVQAGANPGDRESAGPSNTGPAAAMPEPA